MTKKKKARLPKYARTAKLASGDPVRVDLQNRTSPEYEAREGFLFFHVVAQMTDDNGDPCCQPTPDGMVCSRDDGLPHHSVGRGLSIPLTALAAYGPEWLDAEIQKAVDAATKELEGYRAAMQIVRDMREPDTG